MDWENKKSFEKKFFSEMKKFESFESSVPKSSDEEFDEQVLEERNYILLYDAVESNIDTNFLVKWKSIEGWYYIIKSLGTENIKASFSTAFEGLCYLNYLRILEDRAIRKIGTSGVEHLSTSFESLPDYVFIVNKNQKEKKYINPTFETLYTISELFEKNS